MKRFFVRKSHVNNSYYVVFDYSGKKEVSRLYPGRSCPEQIAGFMNRDHSLGGGIQDAS